MVEVSTTRVGSLERWSSTLLLVAGGLIVGHAAIRGIEAFTEMPVPADVFAPAGYLVALLGLFGLYPSLVEEEPTFARAAAVVAAVPFAGWIVISTWSLGELAGVLPDQAVALPGAFFVVHLVTVVLTYVLFGVSSLRADAQDGTIGLLLLAPALLFVGMVVGDALVGYAAVGAFAVGTGQALVHLAIGSALQTASPSGTDATVGDVTGS